MYQFSAFLRVLRSVLRCAEPDENLLEWPQNNLRSTSILVVYNGVVIQAVLIQTIADERCQEALADGGKRAIDFLDRVTIDIGIPYANGMEVLLLAKHRAPRRLAPRTANRQRRCLGRP